MVFGVKSKFFSKGFHAKKRVNLHLSISIIILGLLFSCKDDEGSSIPSAEDRKNAAIENLIDELTDPVNGWKLEYRPNTDNGAYLILLDFNDDGTVTINSDVTDDDGDTVWKLEGDSYATVPPPSGEGDGVGPFPIRESYSREPITILTIFIFFFVVLTIIFI